MKFIYALPLLMCIVESERSLQLDLKYPDIISIIILIFSGTVTRVVFDKIFDESDSSNVTGGNNAN